MSILMRGGLLKDFDPNKMLPREWAVTTDPQTKNQIVYMCFAAGVVKRMGTYEDFMTQIQEIEKDIAQYFYEVYQQFSDDLRQNTEQYIQGKVDNDWIPSMQALVDKAAASEEEAANSASAAKESEDNTKIYEQNAADSADESSQSANIASQEAQTATEKAEEAEEFSKLSESYNHGGTGVRLGEDTDNSKYWSEQSKLEADRAKVEADKVEKYAGITAPDFYLDLDDMVLYIKDGVGVDFMLDEDDALYWEVA